MDAHEWNRAELARRTDSTESTWSRFFRGETKELKPRNANALCQAFDISIDELTRISLGVQNTGEVHEPGSLYETKWIRLGKWLENQPPPVQHAIEAVAKSHDWGG